MTPLPVQTYVPPTRQRVDVKLVKSIEHALHAIDREYKVVLGRL